MATSLSISPLAARIGWTFTNTNDFGTTSDSSGVSYSATMTNGTGSGAANKLFAKSYTIAASGNQSIDLAGSVTDFYGNTISFTKVKVIYVEHSTATTATTITVGVGGTNPFINWIKSAGTITTDQPRVVVRNGGVFLLACTDGTGYPVTAGTGDILYLTNEDGTNSATVKVVVVGE